MKNAKGTKPASTKKTPTLVAARCAHDGCEATTVMPFARAAKGTHRCPEHSKKPATGAPTEVTLDRGTVAVLPNPADAPVPPKAARKKKTAPTVAEVLVPEAAPPSPKQARAAKPPKAKAAPAEAPPIAAPAGSLRAIGDAWIAAIKAQGHSASTVSSYCADLELAYEHLGATKPAADLTERQIAGFNTSALVLKKKSGKPKAQPTILKTRRALRLALTWAEQQRLIKKAPYSAA